MLEIGKINTTISEVLEKLAIKGRIDDSFKQNFYASFTQPTLQIGVVGRMKSGKSSLINALIFGRDMLDARTEPVTVTLTQITYGEKNQVSVTFISGQDLTDLKKAASYNGHDESLCSLKEHAEDILTRLPDNYENFIGKTLDNVTESELSKYIAANGEYSSLVKSVLIQIKNDDLKGITIIDTPGFNDPVASRGKTTRKFLSECHVVLFVHNEDGYDITDAELLTSQIEYAGISKLIEVFNRMDMRRDLSLSEWSEKVNDFLEDREEYLSEDTTPVAYRLVEESNAVPASAFMALCGMNPKEGRSDFTKKKIAEFEERYPELSEDNSQSLESALIECSNIGSIIKILNNVAKERERYLIEKPIQTIIGKLRLVIEIIESEIKTVDSDITLLNQDRESALADLAGLTNFIHSVKESVTASPLKVLLIDDVNNTRTAILKDRATEADSVNKEAYPETYACSTGITKANISAFNVFLSHFQSILRNETSSLTRTLESTSSAYIRKTILSLVNPQISQQRIDNFENKTKNAIKAKLQNILINIEAYALESIPGGKAEQWSKLRTNFVQKYDDAAIDDLLKDFRDVCDQIGIPSFITNHLISMEEDLSRELSQSPAAKAASIEDKKRIKRRLEDELSWAQKQLESLTNL